MFVLRCTKKLQGRLGIANVNEDQAKHQTTLLADWYANLLSHHRRPVVLFVSERTLLPVVVALGPASSLVPRFVEALGAVLHEIGIAREQVRAELAEMASWSLGRTESRRVLGSMNDFAWLLDAVPRDETYLGAALGLADAPCSPIGGESPNAATRALFGMTAVGSLH